MTSTFEITLDEAVGEVLNYLTGLDLHYIGELDRYRSITKHLNRALRLTAVDHEWSYYSSLYSAGRVSEGTRKIQITYDNAWRKIRPRIITEDAIRFVDETNAIRRVAYYVPRESLHKYSPGSLPAQNAPTKLWAASTRSDIEFSRPLEKDESKWTIYVPVMREPKQFVVPATLENIEELIAPDKNNIPENATLIQLRNFHNPEIVEEWVSISGQPPYEYADPEKSLENMGLTSQAIRDQILDFPYPDLIIMRAAFLYAQTDPVMQPRVQTLEAAFRDLYYGLVERDTFVTEDAYKNTFKLPIENGLNTYNDKNPYVQFDLYGK